MKCSPQPWFKAYTATCHDSSSHCLVKSRVKTIARSVNQVATPEDEANFTLFAAAPKLLLACQRILAFVEPDLPELARDDPYGIAIDKLRQAIAIATQEVT